MSTRTVNADEAAAFLRDADLPAHRGDDGAIAGLEPPSFDAAKEEKVVVGSGMVSFRPGVTQAQREAISNSLLLAQLVLKKQNVSPQDAQTWFHEYAGVLAHLGWLVETSEVTEYVSNDDGLDVHEAIMAVAAVLLGPGAVAAAPLIEATLRALRSMDTSTPWITLFNRESRRATTASFQLSLADADPQGKVTVSMMAFTLDSTLDITQVLFFKVSRNDASLKRVATVAEINLSVLDAVQNDLRDKVSSFTSHYLSDIAL
jgi:hypothetical protein